MDELQRALDFRNNYESKVREAAGYINDKINGSFVSFGVTLGSGLGDLADSINVHECLDYLEIPNFPEPTVEGHEGKLIYGKLEGVPVIGLKGRVHFYEHADDFFNNGMLKSVFPVHVLAELGIKNYFVTNAAGGLNTDYKVGDIMVLDTHIHLQPNPLLGRHHNFTRVDNGQRVWRFQPQNDAYDKEFSTMLTNANMGSKHVGTYLAVTGPTYETKGECKAFRNLGADAVGMSTTAEVKVAKSRGMSAVGFSCITNEIPEDGNNDTDHDEVKAVLDSPEVRTKLSSTVKNFFREYSQRHMI